MGMSADFAVAIQFGATHVRVGSAIFGHPLTRRLLEPDRHLADRTEIRLEQIAGLNRQGWMAGACCHDLARSQRHAELTQFVGKPGQCYPGIAKHVLAVTGE